MPTDGSSAGPARSVTNSARGFAELGGGPRNFRKGRFSFGAHIARALSDSAQASQSPPCAQAHTAWCRHHAACSCIALTLSYTNILWLCTGQPASPFYCCVSRDHSRTRHPKRDKCTPGIVPRARDVEQARHSQLWLSFPSQNASARRSPIARPTPRLVRCACASCARARRRASRSFQQLRPWYESFLIS